MLFLILTYFLLIIQMFGNLKITSMSTLVQKIRAAEYVAAIKV